MPIICSIRLDIKYFAVYIQRRMSWMKPTATNFRIRLMHDFLLGSGGYKQILPLILFTGINNNT